jgi:winged helix DNA-binding protein
MPRLSAEQVTSWRLSRHHLDERAEKGRLTKVVEDVCGIQAQVLSGAAIGIWARVDGVSAEDIDDLIWKRHTLVKTWAMRGTLHLLSATDLPVYVAALRTRLKDMEERLVRNHKLIPGEMEQVVSEIRKALDGRCLTREQLADRIGKRSKIGAKFRRLMLSGWGDLLQPAAYDGSLCFGPSQGANVSFVKSDQWLGRWEEPDSEEALRTLVLRFAACYGPVTRQDFQHWWSKPDKKTMKVIESAFDQLDQVEFEGRQCWLRKQDVDKVQKARPVHAVSLLPSWDCYVMFYHPRELFVPARFRSRIFDQIHGNKPVLLIDGIAAGIWDKKKRGKRLEIHVEPFRHLSPMEKKSVLEEAEGLGEFLGLTSQVQIPS